MENGFEKSKNVNKIVVDYKFAKCAIKIMVYIYYLNLVAINTC